MNREVKARWVAALRSGKYQQTQYTLKSDEGYCCLGVLCDLYATDAGMATWTKWGLSDKADPHNTTNVADDALPGARVLIWAQLDPEVRVRIKRRSCTLYDHNDAGRTFAQIADAIEAQL